MRRKTSMKKITLYPAAGFGKFVPEKWDEKLGSFLNL